MTALGGAAPPVMAWTGLSSRHPGGFCACTIILSTTGAPQKCVTPCWLMLLKMAPGSTCLRQICVPPTAVTAQMQHQPLQWNIGKVHRYTEDDVKPDSRAMPRAFR